ncbi:phage head closure protein [Desulfovibrio sp. OttesenSCG-928-A18]|nr:phage head closure protein [Desulfovibrio sp. OttesenSCG-928-A18]
MADQYLLASRLTSRITFQKKVSGGRNPDGSPKGEEWVDHKSTWAEVITIGGEEGRRALADSAETRYRVTFRGYHKDIEPSMRVKLGGGKTVAITSLPRDPDGRGVLLELNLIERQGDV